MKRTFTLFLLAVASVVLIMGAKPSFADFDYDHDPCEAVGPETFEDEVDTQRADHHWWEACEWWIESDDAENEGYYLSSEHDTEEVGVLGEEAVEFVEVEETEDGHIAADEQLPVTGLHTLLLAILGLCLSASGAVLLRRR